MLQVVYIVLGILGWWQWIYGGVNRTELQVNRTSIKELTILFIVVVIATIGLREYFVKINDAAPLLDALTTVLSLVAQYLLNCKRIESWFVWILADVIYVGLYIQKDLYLTAVLYAIFIAMCIAGFISWRRSEYEMAKKAVAK